MSGPLAHPQHALCRISGLRRLVAGVTVPINLYGFGSTQRVGEGRLTGGPGVQEAGEALHSRSM